MKKFVKEYNKTIIITILVVIVCLISGLSYAYFIFTDVQQGQHVGTSDCFKLTFTDSNDIIINDAYPLTDSEALNLTPYTFTIKNVCQYTASYDVTIEDMAISTMNLNGVKYKIDNLNSAYLGTITPNQNVVLTGSKSSRTILSSTLNANQQVTHNLRLWIGENATSEDTADKIFNSKIVIISTFKK